MPSTPGTINYPTALDDLISLVEAANVVRETLTADITSTTLLIPVTNIGKFSNSGIATLLDHPTSPTLRENFVYTSKSGGNLEVPSGGRGLQGTAAQSFATGAIVAQRPTQLHHKVLADAIRALEAKLGIDPSTPGAAVQALMSNGAGKSIWRALQAADVANVVRKDDTALQTIISSLALSKDGPQIVLTDTTGAGAGSANMAVDGGFMGFNGAVAAFNFALASGIVSFAQIPLGPAANPTLANQFARKQYVDETTVTWSANWAIDDPATFPLNTFQGVKEFIVPPGNEVKITQWRITYCTGSASGSFTISLRKRVGGTSAQTTIGAPITINPGSAFALVTQDVNPDFTLAADESVYIILDSRSSPLQKDVQISAHGTQKRLAT